MPAQISFNKNIGFEKQGIYVGEDDVYFNYGNEKDKLVNGLVPWDGACENHPTHIQILLRHCLSFELQLLMSQLLLVGFQC